MKILITDDSTGIRVKLRRYLEELGHTVVGEAANGAEALVLYHKYKPDLITLDIVMPELDGMKALLKLREEVPNANVVMISSASTLSNRSKALDLGALYFLIKPFRKDDVATLMEEVEKLIANQEAA